ncbi:hypothetical protein GCM10010415_28580 [Streptomyces atrovirens]
MGAVRRPTVDGAMWIPGPRARTGPGLPRACGHVCSVMGTEEYPALAERLRVPIVVTGFEPLDILEGVRRAVRAEGSPAARAVLDDVFEVADRAWRGIGVIPGSGRRLPARYREHDAEHRFQVGDIATLEPAECRASTRTRSWPR